MKLHRISGLEQCLTTDKKVVGIVEHKGRIIVACSDGIYELLEGDRIELVHFVELETNERVD